MYAHKDFELSWEDPPLKISKGEAIHADLDIFTQGAVVALDHFRKWLLSFVASGASRA
jgi:hypothetical protein